MYANNTNKHALIILPHHDDEYFFLPIIDRLNRYGENITFIFTTYGSQYGTDQTIRFDETARALEQFGVCKDQITNIGETVKVFDGSCSHRLFDIFAAIKSSIDNIEITDIYTMAWEGGHPDHDATHMAAAAIAYSLNIESRFYAVPAYNGYKLPGPLFRFMHILPNAKSQILNFSFLEGYRYFSTMENYRSQWKTFAAFLPLAAYRFLYKKNIAYYQIYNTDFLTRPHPGALYYERRFNVGFEEFSERTSEFRRFISSIGCKTRA